MTFRTTFRDKRNSRQISLIDYYLAAGQPSYYSLPLSEDGRIWLPEVNLWLGVDDGSLVCHDGKGNRIGTILEERQARIKAEAKSAALEEQIKKLEERLRHGSGSKGKNGTAGK